MSSPVEMETASAAAAVPVVTAVAAGEKNIPVVNATPVRGRVIHQHHPAPSSTTTLQQQQGGRHYYHDRNDVEREPDTCVFRAFLCVYQAFTLNVRCRGTGETLCLRKTACFECVNCNSHGDGAQSRGVGFLTDLHEDEYCRLACHCCDYALVKPKICCGGATHMLCLRQVGSFPHHPDYLEEVVCADYCISCLPDCKIGAPPPKCPALDNMELELGVPMMSSTPTVSMSMDRGGGGGRASSSGRPVVVQGDYIQVAQSDDHVDN